MRTRQALAAAGLAALAVGVATAGDGRAAGAASCGPAGTTTLLASRDARVFRRGSGRWIYGCAHREGRVHRLPAPPRADISQSKFVALDLRGRYVAYAVEQNQDCRGDGVCDVKVLVYDLRAGKRIRVGGVQTDYGDDFDTFSLRATDAVLGARGSVAFILATTRSRYVYALEGPAPEGEQTLLDSGSDVGARSLAESDGTVYWTRGGAPRSAPLR